MKKIFGLMVAVGMSIASATVPAQADDHKAELIQLIRQKDGNLESMAVDKLFTFNMSPEWWEYALDDSKDLYHTFRILADSLMTFGQNEGGDDIPALDEHHDGSNPLIADALDKLSSKAHITIDMTQPVTAQYREGAVHNLNLVGYPITEKYYCKPRGHKLMLTITIDPKAKAPTCTVTPDGNTYHFVLPAFMSISTSPIEQGFKKGT